MLLPAVQSQQNIECESISEKLLYNINHIVNTLLHVAWGGEKIMVIAKKVCVNEYDSVAVGCGCSLGIDSFAAILAHSSKTTTTHYQLTHLTNFNVGAFGSTDLVLAEESWNRDLEKVREFTMDYGLPLVTLDSNIGIASRGTSFDKVFLFRNAAAVLALQKLFRRYFIGSGRHVSQFKIDRDDISFYEALLIPMLSTECTELVLSEGDKTRVEKTADVMDNDFVKKHLYVCWKEIFKNEWPNYWNVIKDSAEKHRNCTKCDKCLRTCLTLDLLGRIDDYKDVFDLPQYYKTRNNYIKKVISKKDYDSYCSDIYKLLREKQNPIPISFRIYTFYVSTINICKKIVYKIIR